MKKEKKRDPEIIESQVASLGRGSAAGSGIVIGATGALLLASVLIRIIL